MPGVIRVRSRNGGRSQVYAKVGGKARVLDNSWSATSLSNVIEMKVDLTGNFSASLYISVYAENQLYYDLELINEVITTRLIPTPTNIPLVQNLTVNQTQLLTDSSPKSFNFTSRAPNATLFVLP